MSERVRTAGAAVLMLLVFAGLVWGCSGLPPFGHYPGPDGDIVAQRVAPERKIANAISAVNFDYRGLDTLGEEFILFAAVAGIAMVLRNERRETTDDPLPEAPGRDAPVGRSDALQAFAVLGVGATFAYAVYLAIHPHLSPGGGFQGAATLAGFAALVFLGIGYGPFEKLTAQPLHEMIEGIGAGAYAVIGLATLVLSGFFLANTMPLGSMGRFFSGGTVPLINAFVAVEVFAGFVLMFVEFGRETRVEREEDEAK